VKDVIVKNDDLIIQLKLQQKPRVKIEEQISFNIYIITDNPNKSTAGLNDDFTHSLLLINGILRLKSFSNDHKHLISLCKKECKSNTKQLNMIGEFIDEYTPDHALYWYTRESFSYRMLGKALRVQNDIDLLISFHFIISDIYKQLKQNQCKSSVHVYRGQVMWSSELKYLRQSKNGYFSTKSFLLTNTSRGKVLDSLNSIKIADGQRQVLFSINADPSVARTKTFADISKFSSPTEGIEILFMFGCIFRLIEVENDGDISIIQMQLCGDDEPDLKHLFVTMREVYGYTNEDNKIDLRTFGDTARRMGKYELAEKIYCRAIDELSPNDPFRSDLYCALGTVKKDRDRHDDSLKCYKEALDIKKRMHPPDFVAMGHLHNCIGEAYTRKENDADALKHYKKAIELFQEANAGDHPHMADFNNNIGSVYKRRKEYSKALTYYNKALSIDEKHSSSGRSNAAKSLNNIGIICCQEKQYDRAMDYYQRSLKIKLNTYPPQQLSIAKTYKNIGYVHEKQNRFQQALDNYLNAATIYRELLPPQHPFVQHIESDIQNIS
jgi:tetratricopeptide (TPR) repeat protein